MRAASKQQRVKVQNFLPAGGVCTTHEPWLLPANKLADGRNVMLTTTPGSKGLLIKARSRPGTRRVTSAPLPNGEAVLAHLVYGGTHYLASDAALYRLDGDMAPVLIGAVAGRPGLVGYRGLVVALDGGLAKAADPDNGHAWSVLYDVDGYLWSWLDLEEAGFWKIHADGTTRAGVKAQAPDWGPGEIPLNQIRLYLSKQGSPTGQATIKALASDGTTLLGSATVDLEDLGSEPLLITTNLTPTGPGLETAAGAWRYYVVEYDDGDADNCVKLHYGATAGGSAVTHDGGSWSADPAKSPRLAVGPGLPPDLVSVGAVKGERLVVGGQEAKAYYCGLNDPYSWGAKAYNGGSAGWIGVARHEGGAINAVVPFYDDLFFSKADSQSIHRLTGTAPGQDGDWTLLTILNQEGALAGRTMADIGDNILYLDEEVLGLEGIEGYGDVRKFPLSRDLADLIQAHRDADAFAVYNRAHDQYWLHLPDLDQTLVLHTLPRAWTSYQWAGLEPTCFSHHDGQTYLGSGGHLYVLDEAVQGRDGYVDGQDAGQNFVAEAWGPMLDLGFPHQDKEFKALAFQVSARLGVALEVMFKTDFGKVSRSELARSFVIPLDDDVTLGDLANTALTVGDALYPVAGAGNRRDTHALNFNARMCQVGIRLDPGGAPVHLGPVILTYAVL